MRLEAILWSLVTVYYLGIGLLYFVLSGEVVGTTLLLLGSAFGGLVAGWLWQWNRRHSTRAEDLASADAADQIGVVGIYPTASLRPLGLGVGMTGIVLGLAVGLWMTLAGLGIVASQVALLVRDADR